DISPISTAESGDCNELRSSRSGLKRTKLSGRRAGPSFESVCQRRDFPVTEQPRDFGNGQRLIVEIALGERSPKLVQNFSKGCSFLAQLAGQASRAHPEPWRNFRCHGPAVRQPSRQDVLYLRPDGGSRPGTAFERLLRVRPQQFVEVFVTSHNRKRCKRCRKADRVAIGAK